MPNGFITLTPSGVVQPSEGDFSVDEIASYAMNAQDPNGGSVVTLASGAGAFAVRETVPQIRDLIAQEKAT